MVGTFRRPKCRLKLSTVTLKVFDQNIQRIARIVAPLHRYELRRVGYCVMQQRGSCRPRIGEARSRRFCGDGVRPYSQQRVHSASACGCARTRTTTRHACQREGRIVWVAGHCEHPTATSDRPGTASAQSGAIAIGSNPPRVRKHRAGRVRERATIPASSSMRVRGDEPMKGIASWR